MRLRPYFVFPFIHIINIIRNIWPVRLAQLVLQSIPSYTMQIILPPKYTSTSLCGPQMLKKKKTTTNHKFEEALLRCGKILWSACHGALEMTKLFQFGILFVLLKIHHILQIATNRLGSWNSSCLIWLVVTNTQCQSYTPFQVILLINVKFTKFSFFICILWHLFWHFS